MFHKFKAVLFDLVGTLVDSMSMWKEIDVEYLYLFGIAVPKTLQQDIEGLTMGQTAVYFKETFGIVDDVEEIQRTWNSMAYEKYTNEVPLKSFAKEFLNLLKEKNILCGIATSNSSVLTDAILESHHIKEYFNAVTTGDDVVNGKPAPEIYLKTAEKLGVEPKDCLVFEDIPVGIIAGKNAGMTVYAVEDNYSVKDREEKMRLADAYVMSYEELL